MRAGYRVTLGILTIMILITMTIGTSYSFYSVSDEQDTANNLTSTCFKIEFKDGEDNITINNAYPMDDSSVNTKITPHTFTIKNTCTNLNSTETVDYKVILSSLTSTEENTGLFDYIKYKLVEENGSASEVTGKLKEATPYTTLPNDIKTTHKIDQSYQLKVGTLGFEETKNYKLYLWIDSAAGNEVMAKKFEGKIIVYADI